MRNPQELIEHVAGILSQKAAKGMRCFYTVKIQKNDATTELIERKQAGNEFTKDIQLLTEMNKPDAIIVELFKGRSRKIKEPESEFYINLQGREIALPVKIEPLNNGFDTSMMITEMRRGFESQLQGIREQTSLFSNLTIAQLELKHSQAKVKELETDLQQAIDHIDKMEAELKSRPQLSGPGGLNLLSLGSYWLEGVLRRNPKIIAGTLGMSEDKAKELFADGNNINSQKNSQSNLPQQNNASATIEPQDNSKEISPQEKQRVAIIEQLAGFFKTLSDANLRTTYELFCLIQNDLSLLQTLKELAESNKK